MKTLTNQEAINQWKTVIKNSLLLDEDHQQDYIDTERNKIYEAAGYSDGDSWVIPYEVAVETAQ